MKLSVSAFRAQASAHQKILSSQQSQYQLLFNYGATGSSCPRSTPLPAPGLGLPPLPSSAASSSSNVSETSAAVAEAEAIMVDSSGGGAGLRPGGGGGGGSGSGPRVSIAAAARHGDSCESSTGGASLALSAGTSRDDADEEDDEGSSSKRDSAASSDKSPGGNRTKSNQRWMKLRTTVQLSGAISSTITQKKAPLKREDSFLKRFSTRQVPEAQETVDTGDEGGEGGADTASRDERRRRRRRQRLPRTVVNPDENFYFYWLLVLTACVLYNLWTLIVRQSFPELQAAASSFWTAADAFSDTVCVLDVVVQFRTGYLEQGLMVYDSKKLAGHYVRSRAFLLDLAALLPLDLLQFATGPLPILRCPRFLKIYRVYHYYYMVESRTVYPNLWRVINLVHILLILAHWFGCFYYLLSEAEDFQGDWVYPYRPGDYATLTRKYLGSLYWSTLTLTTIGDLPTPETNAEGRRQAAAAAAGRPLPVQPRRGLRSRLLQFSSNRGYVFTIVSYLIGVFIFATIVGQVGNVITNRNANRLEFERLLDGAKTYMRHHKVPGGMKRRVLRWYDYSWSRGRIQGGGDINTALGLLPDKLKTELALHVNLSVLKKVTIFQECQPEFLHDLVLKMKAYIFTPGDLICRKGEVAREMFIIADGILEVISEAGRVLTTMKAGDFFGEIGILNLDGLNKRTADVRSVGYSELFSLSREDVLAAMKDYPEAQEILQSLGRKRLMEARNMSRGGGGGGGGGRATGDGDDDRPKRIVERLRSDVKGLRNALRKSRRSHRRKDDGSLELQPLHSCDSVASSSGGGGRKGALQRMARVQGASDDVPPDAVVSSAPLPLPPSSLAQAPSSPLGAGLPLLQRLRLLKEKQEREERQRLASVAVATSSSPAPGPLSPASSLSPPADATTDEPLRRLLPPSAPRTPTSGAAPTTAAAERLHAAAASAASALSSALAPSPAPTTGSGSAVGGGAGSSMEPSEDETQPQRRGAGVRLLSKLATLTSKESSSGPNAIAASPTTPIATSGAGPAPPPPPPPPLRDKASVPAVVAASSPVVAATAASATLAPPPPQPPPVKKQPSWLLLKQAALVGSATSASAGAGGGGLLAPKGSVRLPPLLGVLPSEAQPRKLQTIVCEPSSPLAPSSYAAIAASDDTAATPASPKPKPRPAPLRLRSVPGGGAKRYASIDDLSPEYAPLPFVKKLKILNERQKLFELERQVEAGALSRSWSLDSGGCGSGTGASSGVGDGADALGLTRSSSEASAMAYVRAQQLRLANASPASPRAASTTAASGDEPHSPESNETLERRHLKSILKKLSASNLLSSESDTGSPCGDGSSTVTGSGASPRRPADLRRLLRAPTVEGYAARHSKLCKSVTFNRDTLQSPPGDGDVQPLGDEVLNDVLGGDNVPVAQAVQVTATLQSAMLTVTSVSPPPEPAPATPPAAPDPPVHTETDPLTAAAEKKRASLPPNLGNLDRGPLGPALGSHPLGQKNFLRLAADDEYFGEVIGGIKQVLQAHLEEIQSKFQRRFQSLELEVRKRDEIISQLQKRIRELEGSCSSSSSAQGREGAWAKAGSAGSGDDDAWDAASDQPFMRGDSVDTVLASPPPSPPPPPPAPSEDGEATDDEDSDDAVLASVDWPSQRPSQEDSLALLDGAGAVALDLGSSTSSPSSASPSSPSSSDGEESSRQTTRRQRDEDDAVAASGGNWELCMLAQELHRREEEQRQRRGRVSGSLPTPIEGLRRRTPAPARAFSLDAPPPPPPPTFSRTRTPAAPTSLESLLHKTRRRLWGSAPAPVTTPAPAAAAVTRSSGLFHQQRGAVGSRRLAATHSLSERPAPPPPPAPRSASSGSLYRPRAGAASASTPQPLPTISQRCGAGGGDF